VQTVGLSRVEPGWIAGYKRMITDIRLDMRMRIEMSAHVQVRVEVTKKAQVEHAESDHDPVEHDESEEHREGHIYPSDGFCEDFVHDVPDGTRTVILGQLQSEW
jgi:hypothetical protein